MTGRPMLSLRARSVLDLVRSTAFWRDRWNIALLGLAFLVNVAAVGWVVYQYVNLPEFLPLHYNAHGDVDYIGTRIESFRIPAVGTIIWLSNAVLGLLLYGIEPLASRLLVTTAAATQLLVLVAVVTVIH